MLKSLTLIIGLSVFVAEVKAQLLFKGKLSDAAGIPLSAVSVYINNTTTGTLSDADGNFVLSVPLQTVEVVFSSIGYETHIESVDPEKAVKPFTGFLKEKSATLEALVLRTYDKNGWAKWGKLFTTFLIGTGPAASKCVLKNKDVVRFVFDAETRTLTAHPTEPLVIENKTLGYKLTYDLLEFSFNHDAGRISYKGLPFFESIDAKKSTAKRNQAYNGSLMHFLRSVYRNTLEKEGFTVNRVIRYVNPEKVRVKKLYKTFDAATISGADGKLAPDSIFYYQGVLRSPDSLDYTVPEKLAADSFAFSIDSVTAGMSLNGHLAITHAAEKSVPGPFGNTTKIKFPRSVIRFKNSGTIVIFADGTYVDAANIICEGYWAVSEKLGNLLPQNYLPGD